MNFDKFQSLYQTYRQIQKTRITFQLRLSAIERGADKASDVQREICRHYLNHFEKLEGVLWDEVVQLGREHPLYPYLLRPYLGDGLVLSFLALLPQEQNTFPTVSKLWRYCGYAVVNGKAERPVRGQKIHYNVHMKSLLYLIGMGLIRKGSPYRQVYDEAREKYAERFAIRKQIHYAALRKVIKLWLAHLWETWRRLEGLPVRLAYVFTLGEEHTYESPVKYGWKEVT